MVSLTAEIVCPPLVVSLEASLQALAHLHATAARLRPTDECPALGFPAFSLFAIDRLRSVIRQGGASVTRRLKELVSDATHGARLPELWREGASRLDAAEASTNVSPPAARSRSMLAAYRAACRSLCLSLQEARRCADGATAVMLSALLQRLEKQLWLIDSSRERVRVGLPTINLFLSC